MAVQVGEALGHAARPRQRSGHDLVFLMPIQTARRTHGFRESVIRGMTRLAREYDSINLAQGFPNFAAPDALKEAAVRAVRDDINQYAITWGAQHLREALARTYASRYGLDADPEREITVTCGATEA